MEDLSNIVALVTGAASGLGAATAQQLNQAGAKVVLLDRSDAVLTTAEQIGAKGFIADVCDETSVAAILDQLQGSIGIPRILINCAGIVTGERIVGRQGPQPLENFSRVIEVNLLGTFNMMRLVAARMLQLNLPKDEERGVMINTASVAAFDGQVGQAAYSASKGAIAALTLPAAREFAQFGIRVMTIAPGIFATPMAQSMPEEVQQSLVANVPFPKRMGQPSEYARLALHIIQNQMLNGEVIRLDGAIRMPAK